jgi:hypothetical protein
MALEWAFCHSVVGQMPQAGPVVVFCKMLPSMGRSDSQHCHTRGYWNSASGCREGAPSLGYVMFVTLQGAASGVAAAWTSRG